MSRFLVAQLSRCCEDKFTEMATYEVMNYEASSTRNRAVC